MAIGRRSAGQERREPRFDAHPEASFDVRLSPGDRPSHAGAGPRREPGFGPDARPEPDMPDGRREPSFGSAGPAEPEPREKLSYWSWVMGRSRPSRARSGGPSGRPPRKRRSLIGRLFSFLLVMGVLGALAGGGVIAYYASGLPPIDKLEVPKRPPNVTIVSLDGRPLANRGETGGANVPLSEMPAYVPQAFISIEDRRFRDHWGVDFIGLARAMATNLQHGTLVQGGSTLTQQLAKNLFLTPERSLERKVQEAVLAFWLERKFGKDRILEMYLNRVYFGAGAYGVEAAAQRYFGKSIRKVNISEAATLAGLVKAPSRLAPTRDPEGARARADLVLSAMADEGYISRDEANRAFRVSPPSPAPKPQGAVGYVADWIMDQLDGLVGVYDEDLTVETTLDPKLESEAEKALSEAIAKRGPALKVSQGALVALAPDGAVRALVGGRSYAESQFNRAVSSKRQPGSAFKPFVYLAALELGMTPDTVQVDAPLKLKGWNPENYNRRYGGPMTLTSALSHSVNTVAVRLGVEVGPLNVIRTARRVGITSDLAPNPSVALGTSEVTPLELAGAYAPFANGGMAAKPYVVRRVVASTGEVLYNRRPEAPQEVVDIERVGMMNAMLSETVRSGTARGASLPGWPAAGKTGTSQDFRDAWFVGYTSHLVTAVWLGNDDNSPTKKASGGGLPVQIWSRFMTAAHAGAAVASLPGDWRPQVAGYGEGQPGGEVYEDGPPPGDGWVEERVARERPRASEPLGFLKRLFGGY
ncbi:penicillin-binding protein [Methylopila jiangsuensis]|uniref:Penicillin-binding protein n=1 Tax=Methylopila jiangsuensis TaxID=586230 RepID=A0A9W6N3M1_9HYPH|nr:penicillin-binding protein 1A [Methylopila jiangsuensis]MDR6284049.1 penicillin-binding protein 1A [Methylopila jiangsuensis]GLK76438.1 penicillin-binding protein [Methylopila jiangsuensis]